MLSKVYGGAVFGIEATTITVEVNIGRGLCHCFAGGNTVLSLKVNQVPKRFSRLEFTAGHSNRTCPVLNSSLHLFHDKIGRVRGLAAGDYMIIIVNKTEAGERHFFSGESAPEKTAVPPVVE